MQRVLLSVSVVKETLTIEGGAGRDDISLSVHPQVINLMSLKINGDEKVFLLGSFKVININTLGGSDTVRIGELYSAHPAYLKIDLGAGDDRAYGSAHNETIIGGNGNDRISAGAGADSVNGGAGNDVLAGDAGKDSLIGLGGKDTIFGGEDADSIAGGEDADTLDGENGSDTIDAGAGNDRMAETETATIETQYTGAGYGNLINAGSGDDYVAIGRNGAGSNVFGGDGKDYLLQTESMYSNAPTLRGEGGDDKIIGVNAYGGAGNDTIVGTYVAYSSTVDGESGNDSITLTTFGNGSAGGGAGDDVLRCESALSAVLNGGDGNDRLESLFAGGVTLNGGAGNDTLTGNTTSNGGAGDDLLQPASGVLKAFATSNGNSYPCNFLGDEGSDLIVGSAYADCLNGGAGDDILHGMNSPDWLNGNAGNDILFGGNDVDQLYGGDGNDSLFAGGFKDTRRDDDGKDSGFGEEGEDYFDENSKWGITDRKKSDAAELNLNGSLFIGDSRLNGITNFDDLLTLAQNYRFNTGSGSWGSGSYSGMVSYNDLLKLAQDYGQNVVTPTNPTPVPTPVIYDDAITIFRNAAIFSGTAENSPTATTITLPDLSTAERKSIRGQVVHVPSDWKLTRVGVKSGLTWYTVRRNSGSHATVYGRLQSNARASLGEKNLQVSVIGVHSASLVLYDGDPRDTRLSDWALPQSYTSLSYWVTKPKLKGLLAGSDEAMSFNAPDMDALDRKTLDAGVKYIYTTQGLRPISANGIGAIVS